MNNLKKMVHRVPEDTRDVIKQLAECCNLSQSAIRKTIANPSRDMMATPAILAVKYFNRYYPCSIEDLIQPGFLGAAKKLRLTKPSSSIDSTRKTIRRKPATL